ncbi:MAG: NAD(P)-binding protein, partial [Rhodospirillales bacterium]|nr:NAD(P)-binding protein [Rhodospirillales bacterium]
MSVQFAEVPDEAGEISARWLDSFGAALQAQDAASVAATFMPDGHWRDVLAFTWDVVTHSGRAAIEAALAPVLARTAAKDVEIPGARTPPRRAKRAGIDCIEAIFEFETAFGHANAVVRLVEADGEWRAWSLLTTLEELHGWPDGRPRELSDAERYSRDFGGANWLDQRVKAQAYEDRDPAVLVVGGGQAGLAIAARLRALGVDTLIVDRHQRIGDNWRRRYHSLTLHNEVHVNHLPLMPFPSTFPVFIPKDKLANWFESYVENLDLNYWTDTQLTSGSY